MQKDKYKILGFFILIFIFEMIINADNISKEYSNLSNILVSNTALSATASISECSEFTKVKCNEEVVSDIEKSKL